jgi:ribonuclease HIII
MNYVFEIDPSDIDTLIEYYKGLEKIPEDEHKLVVFKSPGFTVTVYRSHKVMIQGGDAYDEYLMWADMLGFKPEPKKAAPSESKPKDRWTRVSAIGSDEVGTGDFYGPIVVCACYINVRDFNRAREFGIKDSKTINDEQIRTMAPALMKTFSHSVLVLDDRKYNELTSQGYNMNKIKAYLHNHAIRKTLAKNNLQHPDVIVDKFCTKQQYIDYLKGQTIHRDIRMVEKGESYHPAVAAASIIARYTFLKKMDEIHEKIGIRLPLGAGPAVDLIGKRIGLGKDLSIFKDIAKTNFKNMERIKKML